MRQWSTDEQFVSRRLQRSIEDIPLLSDVERRNTAVEVAGD